jgi:hypothetical protein
MLLSKARTIWGTPPWEVIPVRVIFSNLAFLPVQDLFNHKLHPSMHLLINVSIIMPMYPYIHLRINIWAPTCLSTAAFVGSIWEFWCSNQLHQQDRASHLTMNVSIYPFTHLLIEASLLFPSMHRYIYISICSIKHPSLYHSTISFPQQNTKISSYGCIYLSIHPSIARCILHFPSMHRYIYISICTLTYINPSIASSIHLYITAQFLFHSKTPKTSSYGCIYLSIHPSTARCVLHFPSMHRYIHISVWSLTYIDPSIASSYPTWYHNTISFPQQKTKT